VRASVRDSRGSFMFLRYLQYLLTDFRQTFVTAASWDTDDLITFLGQKVKVQGHTIAAEAHSTRRNRPVQLFLVYFWFNWPIFPHLQTFKPEKRSCLATRLLALTYEYSTTAYQRKLAANQRRCQCPAEHCAIHCFCSYIH